MAFAAVAVGQYCIIACCEVAERRIPTRELKMAAEEWLTNKGGVERGAFDMSIILTSSPSPTHFESPMKLSINIFRVIFRVMNNMD